MDSGSVFNIPHIEHSPTHQGSVVVISDLDWGDKGFRVELMPNDAGEVKPATDFDPSFRLAWNEEGLLLLLTVRDKNIVEADDIEELWSRDSFEIFVAAKPGDAEYIHVMFSPGFSDKTRDPRFFMNPKVKSPIAPANLNLHVQYKPIAGGYKAEVIFPWQNLHLSPKAGDEVAFQLMVNDYDSPSGAGLRAGHPLFNAVWFPASDTSRNSKSMHRIRLSDTASPPEGMTATANYEKFLHTHVLVAAGPFAVGKKVRVLDGEKELGQAELKLADGRASTEFRLSMPPIGSAYPALTVTVDGKPFKTLTLPDANDLRMRAYLAERIVFEGFCFGTRSFPECEFEHPELVERLIGPYSIKRSFFDAAGNPVTSAEQPGRYASIVEISHAGRTDRRFFTLFRYGEGFRPRAEIRLGFPIPSEFKIDADVERRHNSDIDLSMSQAVQEGLAHDPNIARLFACLNDLSQSPDGKLSDERVSIVERRWWLNCKRKFYGFDKLYAQPIVCPVPIEGKPAPTLRSGSLAEAGMQEDAPAKIAAVCEQWAADSHEGFNLCVARRGVIVLRGGYGKSKGEPVTETTRLGTASATKFLSAVLMLELVDRGLVKLDETIDAYIPAVRGIEPKQKLTLRDLYLHTTGLPENWGDYTNDIEELAAAYYPLVNSPPHHYQSTGLALGGKIVEMISGELHPDYYRKHLLDPLGCKDTDCGGTSGGATTTADDLAKVAQMLLNGGGYGNLRFLKEETVRQLAPLPGRDRIGPDKKIRWGIGTKLYDSDGFGAGAMGHSGANGAFILIDPERELFVTMTRTDEGKDYLEHRAKLMETIRANIKQ